MAEVDRSLGFYNAQPWWVYVVELFQVRGFYVGISMNLGRRFNQHATRNGSDSTRQYGVLSLWHYELHWGMQTAQARENEVSRYLQSKGALAFGGGAKQQPVTDRAFRDLTALPALARRKPIPYWWQVASGKRPIELPEWPEIVVRQRGPSLEEPVTPAATAQPELPL